MSHYESSVIMSLFLQGLKLYGQDLVSFLLFLVILTDNNKEAVVDSQQKTLLHHITLMVSHSFRSQVKTPTDLKFFLFLAICQLYMQ